MLKQSGWYVSLTAQQLYFYIYFSENLLTAHFSILINVLNQLTLTFVLTIILKKKK